jgi:hypothetical protein
MRQLPEAMVQTSVALAAGFVPRRIQLHRGSKFDLQTASMKVNGLAAVRIDRNSGWENPFLDSYCTPTAAVVMFRRWLLDGIPQDELARHSGHGRFSEGAWLVNRRAALWIAMPSLRGKNIACWCRPRDVCHGDVLLEIANGDRLPDSES